MADNTYNTKNYQEQGGEKWVIGGTLEVLPTATVTGLSSDPLQVATEATLGGIKAPAKTDEAVPVAVDEDGFLFVPEVTVPTVPVAEAVADSVAEDVAGVNTVINAILASLKTAGLMETETEPE
ncbi:hypothetical protein B1774_04455 [Dehalococcoides mccartyi]|uniref:hypothetical protein n=1 Tax=Dehalococcoides mccartyi TaxID=61435 RepID=UPI00098EDBAA|nr:hypothetical protein [Dehalococcoides mccartyi]AQU03356.1 hypothetical protein B1773_04810 [Dehalococcoides mccartyi]AQU04653.1 hypothetical protein B1774_04455 [Dehalococcoides mccartyi]